MAYFELLDQPAPITPKILKEDIANKYNKPYWESKKPALYVKGIITHKNKLNEKLKTGANKNNK